MAYCEQCLEEISCDCMLSNGICVFCHYGIDEWETNGKKITKSESVEQGEKLFQSWREYYDKYHQALTERLRKCVKGTVSYKSRNERLYPYLAYRSGTKVKFKYLGKLTKEELNNLENEIEFRRKIKRKINELAPIRTALKLQKRPSMSKQTRFDIFQRDNFTCQYCGRRAPEVVLEVDHIMPISKAGLHKASNFVTACKRCNKEKRAKLIMQAQR